MLLGDIQKHAALAAADHDAYVEITAELLQMLVDKIIVYEKEVIDGQIIMRVDIYYRFIGKVGTVDSNSLPAPRIRRDTKLLKATSVLPTVGD